MPRQGGMMKKLVLCILFILLWSLMFAEQTQTATMDSTLVSNLRSAVTNGDPNYDEVMDFYYDKMNPGSTRYDGEGDDWREDRASYEPINQASGYATEAFLGVIDVELEYPGQDTIYLNYAKRFLLDPDFPITNPGEYYLSLDSLWVHIDNNRVSAITIGHMLYHVALIVDCLWYYVDEATRDSLYNKLDNIAWGINEAIQYDTWGGMAFVYPEYPEQYGGLEEISFGIGMNNIRIYLDGALGYAGCVLGNEEYIQTVENDLFDWNITRLWWVDGLIDFMSGSDGIYSEGVFYSEMVQLLNSFFTAQKRLYGVNNFERPEMKVLYTESLHLLTPDFHFVTFDDAFLGHVLDNNGNTNVLSFSEVISYYNQGNPTAEERTEIEWIVCGYFQEHNEYPKSWQALTRLYTYNHDCNGAFSTLPSVPQSIAQGSYDGNVEFTIMRPEINDLNEFKNAPYLFVNHENSAAYSGHEHSDQSSFVLYYKGKQLLIDPGYLPARESYFLAKEWLASPYAHNLIMANPECYNDYENVEDELFDDYINIRNSLDDWNDVTNTNPNYYDFNYYSFEPVGRCYYPYNIFPGSGGSVGLPDSPLIPKNPAFRNYMVENDNIQHLQVEIEYDHPQAGETYSHYNGNPDDIINIKRNFYGLNFNEGNEYFVIYDEVTSSIQTNSNDFMNQLHFGLFRPGIMEDQITDINEINSSNGIFEYIMYDNSANLFGALGSLSGNSNCTLSDSLPQGLFVGKNWGGSYPQPPAWEHKALRINTTTEGDEQFLTLLFPSESDTTPIDYVVNSTDGYGVKYKINQSDTCDTYAAVYSGDTHFRFVNDLMQFNTSSDFFLLETNNVCSHIRKLILNGDNRFEIHDLSGTRFDDVLVFDSEYDFEEMIATYGMDGLNVVFKTEWNDHPKYKILKCEVEPENFHASSYFDYYLDGAQPHERYYFEHIQSLAYDNDYFYVNYDYNDLPFSDDLVIYKGTYANITIPEKLTFGTGDLILCGDIVIDYGCELHFEPGAHPIMDSDSQILVRGTIYAIGDSINIIEFNTDAGDTWKGILVSRSSADLQYCIIRNAEIAVYCQGSILNINNCNYEHNTIGVQIESTQDFSISNSNFNYNNNYGLWIKNCYSPNTSNHIRECFISGNDIGLVIYNCNPFIESTVIDSNRSIGLWANHYSSPFVCKTYIGRTRDGAYNNPEINLVAKSYPVITENKNDIPFGFDGYSIINNDSLSLKRYYCREVFWGTNNAEEIEDSFYPPEWEVEFIPFSEEPQSGYVPLNPGSGRFKEGFQAELEGDLINAKEKYQQSISENPDNIEALWSCSRLLNCSIEQYEFSELQEYYNTIVDTSSNVDLVKLSESNIILCDRKLENYQDAIYKYEEILEDDITEIDSICTRLDIVYTYMEADTIGGRASNLMFNNEEYVIISLEHAKQLENEFMGLLLHNTNKGSVYSPIIENIKLHNNYPNPFNPNTNISFSIPEDSKVIISIYNIKGQKVKTLTDSKFERGIHKLIWDSKDSNGKSVSSGIYFYKLDVNGKSKAVRKMLLLK